MNILITNDDGIQSPGITALINVLQPAGHKLYISAPTQCKSACSMSMTIRGTIEAKAVDMAGTEYAIGIEGTTVDCVKIALNALGIPKPDLIVSGVNLGMNIARDLHYSATVGGAMEAALSGFPAIAISAEYDDDLAPAVDDAAAVMMHEWDNILKRLSERTAPLFANINAPARPYKEILYTDVSREGVFFDGYTNVDEGFAHAGRRNTTYTNIKEDLGAITQQCASISFVSPCFR